MSRSPPLSHVATSPKFPNHIPPNLTPTQTLQLVIDLKIEGKEIEGEDFASFEQTCKVVGFNEHVLSILESFNLQCIPIGISLRIQIKQTDVWL